MLSPGLQNPTRGFLLCLVAVTAWGSLPLVLKFTLEKLDPLTVTFFRFSVAAVVVLTWKSVAWFRDPEPLKRTLLSKGHLLLGGLCLTLNHALFVWGLRYSSAANAQLFIQLAPFLFGMVSVYLFKESFSKQQALGVFVLLGGFVLYFSENLRMLASELENYLLGCGLLVMAALAWVIYACVQRELNSRLGPGVVTAVFYVLASLFLLPLTTFQGLSELPAAYWLGLLYCGLNTLVAYGAFAAALHCWESSRVSASLALTPICTLGFVAIFHRLAPLHVAPEKISQLGLLGAAMVVLGSATIALSRKPQTSTSSASPERSITS